MSVDIHAGPRARSPGACGVSITSFEHLPPIRAHREGDRESGRPATRKVGPTLRIGAHSCHSRRVGLKKRERERERGKERKEVEEAAMRGDRP